MRSEYCVLALTVIIGTVLFVPNAALAADTGNQWLYPLSSVAGALFGLVLGSVAMFRVHWILGILTVFGGLAYIGRMVH